MGQKIFLDLIYQSMQDSAQQVRRSLGRPSSRATRQQALQQVAMLKAAKEAYASSKCFYRRNHQETDLYRLHREICGK